MNYSSLLTYYSNYSKNFIGKRYISYNALDNLISNLSSDFEILVEGISELNRPIKSINFGHGSNKIFIWSQMHGNETTTTKSILDILHVISSKSLDDFKNLIFNNCTIKIIPMLNPDGANNYKRVNSNNFDLNRDAKLKGQKETKVFFNVVDDFCPDYCFNMHGQRTIFSAGVNNYPATVSFLAPSYNVEREVNKTRETAMQLIAIANDTLKTFIPNQIARYDDGFNDNCFGDYLTKLGIPTILYEAGHFQNDYYRDETRKYITLSLISMLKSIAANDYHSINYKNYFKVPENNKLFYDVVITNVSNLKGNSIGILYKEELKYNKIEFIPVIQEIGILADKFSHKKIDAHRSAVAINGSHDINLGDRISKLQIDHKIITGIFA